MLWQKDFEIDKIPNCVQKKTPKPLKGKSVGFFFKEDPLDLF